MDSEHFDSAPLDRRHHTRRALGPDPQHGPTTVLADALLALAAQEPDGAVILLGSATPGAGGYGRLSIDPYGDIELRLFGWPRLTPGHDHHVADATAALARDSFSFDGRDWVWRRPYRALLVPVAAYAAQRALADGWLVVADDLASMVRPILLDIVDHALVESGVVCGRCIGDMCVGVPHDSGSDGC